ncbi:MAG TPA: hypothetical protein VJ953_20830 [Saprospiraceae bacterium]|nr:hypothetical protein [Saprospiraceae bacterium]
MENYGPNYNAQDLETTKSALTKGQARAFETSRAKLQFLENISTYNWSPNYITEREKVLRDMSVEKVKALADEYLNPDQMIWLVVGDARTQMARMKELGYGDPVPLNEIKPLDQ